VSSSRVRSDTHVVDETPVCSPNCLACVISTSRSRALCRQTRSSTQTRRSARDCKLTQRIHECFIEAIDFHDGRAALDIPEDSNPQIPVGRDEGNLDRSIAEAIERVSGHVDFAKVDREGAEWRLRQDREAWQFRVARTELTEDAETSAIVRSCSEPPSTSVS
jgi:hypothetical protein